MTRHIADKPRLRGASRLGAFLAEARKDMPSRASKILQSRPRDRDADRRAGHFLAIARGRQA